MKKIFRRPSPAERMAERCEDDQNMTFVPLDRSKVSEETKKEMRAHGFRSHSDWVAPAASSEESPITEAVVEACAKAIVRTGGRLDLVSVEFNKGHALIVTSPDEG